MTFLSTTLEFRQGLASEAGIVLFRIPKPSPEEISRIAVISLESRSDWSGHFSVIEKDRIRMTPFRMSPPG